MTTTGAESSKRAAINLTRRSAERIGVCSVPFTATWLSERQKISGAGVMLDISTGGFGGRMVDAPAHGRLLHTRFALPIAADETATPIEADARVCGRAIVENAADDEKLPEWIVHFAIESIHPVDEKRMTEAMRLLKTDTPS